MVGLPTCTQWPNEPIRPGRHVLSGEGAGTEQTNGGLTTPYLAGAAFGRWWRSAPGPGTLSAMSATWQHVDPKGGGCTKLRTCTWPPHHAGECLTAAAYIERLKARDEREAADEWVRMHQAWGVL